LVCTRRALLALFIAMVLAPSSWQALAKDGDHDDGDHDDGGHVDGGHDDDGGGDDGGSYDGGRDNDGGKDHGGNKTGKHEDDGWSQDKALKERELGRVIPLKTALKIVATKVNGRVIDVDLLARNGRPQYRVKVRRADGVIETVRLDARTGRFIGFLGF
jgi:hypothetical protein